MHVTDVSTQKAQTRSRARLFEAHDHGRRQKNARTPSPQGSRKALPLGMLSKKHRLTTSEVRAILQRGRSVRSQTLSAKFVPAASSKAAVVVKTSITKSAVARNRLRRSAYDALQECLPKKVHSVF